MFTPKQRMLNAYRGLENDVVPAAPEFWFFYPAKVLGIGVDEFQREVPHYEGMLAAFRKFKCEGWGIAGAVQGNPHVEVSSIYKCIGGDRFRDLQQVSCGGRVFTRSYLYSKTVPFWSEQFAVTDPGDVPVFFDAHINDDVTFDFRPAQKAWETVGEDFLLEFDLGLSFFDFFEQFMGFENALYYFVDSDEAILNDMFDRYSAFQMRMMSEAIEKTDFEAYFIGCSSSCNALLGPTLWRKWDKPYEKAMTDLAHKHGKLMHNHNHGKIMHTVSDLVDIGFDCVCPFERPPGDVEGIDGLKRVRELLQDKVTFNGNVHTVHALIFGTPETVRGQVREVKEAFNGSNRVIVGTGDQVGADTPDENLWAMIEETHRKD